MKSLRLVLSLIGINLLCGCQLGYLMKSGYGQFKLLNSRVPVSEALNYSHLTDIQKNKLRIAQEAREFSERSLHLKPTKNYSSYVDLDRPYVTYVVSAAPKWELRHYQWSFPFYGKMPYKGYFNEVDAKTEERERKSENLDTYLRGVSAYSTLGWFEDPLLSSMLNYTEYDLVNTIIHETVHATLFIKQAADFNERLATFIGNRGAEKFYLQKEGPHSPTLKMIQLENEDHRLFSKFISNELKDLEAWYKTLSPQEKSEKIRLERISLIQDRFMKEIQPKLKTDQFKNFPKVSLNNARLLIYKTYLQDLEDFQNLYDALDQNFSLFIEKCKGLESAADPEAELKSLTKKMSAAKKPAAYLSDLEAENGRQLRQ